ncbi:hypothetical protein B2D07_19610 [Desulfococcus multivorans]|jgi:hypothetical protein|nr:hypothetical protein B2D07_19610 [Desulfococcus multivorans]
MSPVKKAYEFNYKMILKKISSSDKEQFIYILFGNCQNNSGKSWKAEIRRIADRPAQCLLIRVRVPNQIPRNSAICSTFSVKHNVYVLIFEA